MRPTAWASGRAMPRSVISFTRAIREDFFPGGNFIGDQAYEQLVRANLA